MCEQMCQWGDALHPDDIHPYTQHLLNARMMIDGGMPMNQDAYLPIEWVMLGEIKVLRERQWLFDFSYSDLWGAEVMAVRTDMVVRARFDGAQAQRGMRGMSRSLKSMAGLIGGTFAVRSLIRFGTESVKVIADTRDGGETAARNT